MLVVVLREPGDQVGEALAVMVLVLPGQLIQAEAEVEKETLEEVMGLAELAWLLSHM